MSKIKLDIVTVEKLVFSQDVDGVTAPGLEGELGILPQHAPLVTMLQPGVVIIKADGEETEMAVSGGYMEVRPEYIIILADSAERAEEIDIARAEAARARAEQARGEAPAGAEAALAAEAALKRSLVRLKVARRRRREKPV
jgi:F-type H+-transporting ATPase subunit epsilon